LRSMRALDLNLLIVGELSTIVLRCRTKTQLDNGAAFESHKTPRPDSRFRPSRFAPTPVSKA
jgi:hypothetical protein